MQHNYTQWQMKQYLREKGLNLPKALELSDDHFRVFKEMARDLKEKKSPTVEEAYLALNNYLSGKTDKPFET